MLSSVRSAVTRRIVTRNASLRYLTRAIGASQKSVAVPLVKISNPTISSCRTFATTQLLRQQVATTENVDSQTPSANPTTFAGLEDIGVDKQLVYTITNKLGYEHMTEVQAKTIPVSNTGVDVIARAKTGTGKTIAFLVPAISRLLNQNYKKSPVPKNIQGNKSFADVRILVVSPTRELAEQIAKEAQVLTKGTNLHVACMVGGTGKAYSLRDFHYRGANILIATPGRLSDVLADETSGVVADNLETLIFDEADSLMSMGFEKEIRQIRSYLPKEKQTLMFSATMPDKVRQMISESMRPGFKFINTVDPNEAETHTKVPQHLITVESFENQLPALFELLHRENTKAQEAGENFKAMVFFATARGAELAAMMFRRLRLPENDSHPLYPLDLIQIHSRLTQNRRTEAANAFRRSENAILFSSDVTARGMDFPNVSHVIQVGAPASREQYIHRIGRTARGKNIESGKSVGYLLLSDMDAQLTLRELRGIKLISDENKDLVTPKANLADLDNLHAKAADYAKSIVMASQKLDSSLKRDAYSSMIGAYMSRGIDGMHLMESLHRMCKFNFGFEQPMTLGRGWALKLALPYDQALRKGFIAPREEMDMRGRTAPTRYSSREDKIEDEFGERRGYGGYSGNRGSRDGFRSNGGGRGGFRSGGDRDGGRDGGRGGYNNGRSDRSFGNRQGGRGGFGGGRGGFGGSGGRREGGFQQREGGFQQREGSFQSRSERPSRDAY